MAKRDDLPPGDRPTLDAPDRRAAASPTTALPPAQPESRHDATLPEAPPEVAYLPRGTAVGRYFIVGFLGEGGMATVYAAYDPELDRRVAVKLLKISGEGLEAARAQLSREAQAMARLSHPNVVPVYDAGDFEGQLFVAMELVEGLTLGSWLAKRSRPQREILKAFIYAGEGLSAAHAKGLVHRDFKPDNVLIGRDGRVRVSDFGLARVHGREKEPRAEERAGESAFHTFTGSFTGTPAYMAPEQLRGEATDERADQFSFCAALWEALGGSLPYGEGDVEQIRKNVLKGVLRPPRRRIPRWAQKALEKGLRLDPDGRHASLKVLLGILRRDGARRLRRTLVPGLLSLALIGALAAIGTHFQREATRCGREADQAGSELWTGRRAEVEQALRATAGLPADDVLSELDTRLLAWSKLRRAACEGAQRGEAASKATLDCLEKYRIDASVMVDTFEKPQAIGEAGHVLLDDLGAPERCNWIRAPLGTQTASAQLRREAAQVAALSSVGQPSQAEERARSLIPQARAQKALDVVAALEELQGRALISSLGPKPEALELLRQAVRDADSSGDDQRSLRARITLSGTLSDDYGRLEEAENVAKDAEAWLHRLGDPPHHELSLALTRAGLLTALGRPTEAIAMYRRSLELCETTGASLEERGDAHNNLGTVLRELRRYAEAAKELELTAELDQKSRWRSATGCVATLGNLGNVRADQGRSAEALALLDKAAGMLAKVKDEVMPHRTWLQASRGRALEDLGRLEEAGAAYQEVLLQKEVGPFPHTIALSGIARLLLAKGEVAQALKAATESLKLAEDPRGGPAAVAQAKFVLARALWESGGDRAQAIALAHEAQAFYEGPEAGFRRGPMEAWLAAHPVAAEKPGKRATAHKPK